MPETRICPSCGAVLPSNTPSYQCVACLLELGLNADPPQPPLPSGEPAAGNTELAGQSENSPPSDSPVRAEAAADNTVESSAPPGTSVEYFGDYLLLGEIARGGMGVVYKARQVSLNRLVALKMILSGRLAGEAEVRRFRTEAEGTANLAHPNIVPIFEIGEHRGHHYFSMELIEGPSLSSQLPRYTDDLESAVGLLAKVARAVHHAHQRGILHHDLKPSNILLDTQGEPHVTGFGLARRGDGDASVTRTGDIMGTPNYIAPEQALGQTRQMTTAVDIWSMGVVLYQMLTGQLPFAAETMLETLRRVVQEEPERPSKVNPKIDKDLEEICRRCLEKEPQKRFTSAEGFADELARWLRGEPLIIRPSGARERLVKWAKRKPAVAALSAGVMSLGALGLTGIVLEWQRVSFCVVLLVWLGLGGIVWQWRRAIKAGRLAEGKAASEASARDEANKQSRAAQMAEAETRMTLATSDFRQAIRLIADDKVAEALCYLQRSLASNPGNPAALTRLATAMSRRAWGVPTLKLQPGHKIAYAHFSPDGRYIGTNQGTLWSYGTKLWDAQTGQQLIDRSRQWVWIAHFTPDRTRIVNGSRDVVKAWDPTIDRSFAEPLTWQGAIAATFSPNGKRILTGPGTIPVCVWDSESGQLLAEILPRSGIACSAQFSPNGKRIVIACDNKTVRVCDAETGRPLLEFLANADGKAGMNSAKFSLDGKRILTLVNGVARVWDAHNGHPMTEPLKHGRWVKSARFSPDGTRVVTISNGRAARVWSAHSGQLLSEFSQQQSDLNSAEFSPDGNRIITASWDGVVRVSNSKTGQPVTEPLKHWRSVDFAEFSPDAKRILTASIEGHTVRVWDCLSGPPLPVALVHPSRVRSAQWSPDGKRVVTVTENDTARVWDAQSGEPLTGPLKHAACVRSAQFSPDGERIITASVSRERECRRWERGRWTTHSPAENVVQVWDVRRGELLAEPLKDAGRVDLACLSLDGRLAVIASKNIVRIWDVQAGQPLGEALQHSEEVSSVLLSRDGRRMITNAGMVQVWDVQSGRPLNAPRKLPNWQELLFSPDGNQIAAFTWIRVCVLDAQRGQVQAETARHLAGVNSAAFSPDGGRIATASEDKTARVWDARSGKPLTQALNHDGKVKSVRFSPDGTRLVTAAWDYAGTNTVHVWDAHSGEPLMEPLDHPERVNWAEFSQDGKRVLTVSEGNVARVFDVAPSSVSCPEWLLRLAEALSGQVLNRQGIIEPTASDPGKTIRQIRLQLNAQRADDDWTLWGRWFLTDPATRSISPFSKVAFPKYIEARIKEGTVESLTEAEQLASGNLEVLARIRRAQEMLAATRPSDPTAPPPKR